MNKAIWLLSLTALFSGATSFAFDLKSADLKSGGTIPDEFIYQGMGCNGKNQSPEIHWSGAPKDAKSFAVTVYDPAAPTGSGWWHWIVVNISAKTSALPKGWKAGDGATEITNDFGNAKYDGPCPPPGKPHPYTFTVYALKTEKLDVPAGATNAYVRFMINSQTIKKASFTSNYGR
ncbi:MAG: YbhB/YbcL family Raf kinase inhibitor-like protein [Bdellovibrionota bacterium]